MIICQRIFFYSIKSDNAIQSVFDIIVKLFVKSICSINQWRLETFSGQVLSCQIFWDSEWNFLNKICRKS